MVRRRAANVVGDTSALKTGSSLYSRMGITHISTPCCAHEPGQGALQPLLQPGLLALGLLAQRAEGTLRHHHLGRPLARADGGACGGQQQVKDEQTGGVSRAPDLP